MVALNQTITVVNKSGKIVSSTKQLASIFNEARGIYNERKAEIRAARREQQDAKEAEYLARKQLEALKIDRDDNDDARSQRSHRSHRSHRSSRKGSDSGRSTGGQTVRRERERPEVERGVSDSSYSNDRPTLDRRHSSSHAPSPLRRDSACDDVEISALARRNTDGLELQRRPQASTPAVRRASVDDIDMDLAYGDLPPLLPERSYDNEIVLRQKMSGLQQILDEFNCIQHTATMVIDHLQKNPDALATVALTLGEISSLVSKMAPGALATLKGAFPTIIALLASPEFAIAAGVGVGVTIIALGGYKIVKKIKAQREKFLEDGIAAPLPIEEAPATPPDEVEELRELNHIEVWRRGIADVEAESLGTSVDGELITQMASRTLIEDGKLTEADFKSRADDTSSKASKERRRHRKHHHSSRTSEARSTTKSTTSTEKPKSRSGAKTETSGLRMLFKKPVAVHA